ncbi:MAG: succinate--CoA ligase subunit alpha [Candidatus Heimdallarchaeota archaeon]|nr:succinate--CoA ligase subunit alpha [Candidatus Heimdallarchaeota archaeon]
MVLLDETTKVIVQGITGYQGQYHAKLMKEYGTQVVGGVRPGKGGQEVNGFPIFDSVKEAMDETGATASVIFVPAKFVKNAGIEAILAGIKLLVIITEGVPVSDAMYLIHLGRKHDVHLLGPNCPGLIVPGKGKIGIIPVTIVKEGNVGVVSRSGTLTYEVIDQLTRAGMGQSTCLGIGGDPTKGLNFVEALELFQNDPNTEKIVMLGEIGGNAEELAADYISKNVNKPVVAFIAGKTAKEGKTMGHAGAIVHGNTGTAEGKIKALESVGVKVATKISEIPKLF